MCPRNSLVLSGSLLLASCSQSLKDIEITSDNRTEIVERIKSTDDLTTEEMTLLQSYLLRNGMARTLADGRSADLLPTGKTLGQIISEQRLWTEEIKKREQERQIRLERAKADERRALQTLVDAINVEVSKKSLIRVRGRDSIQISLDYENLTSKGIRAFKGVLAFRNVFGEEIQQVYLRENDMLPPEEVKPVRRTIEYNEFSQKDQELVSTDLADLTVEWRPELVMFSDGSELSLRP